MHAIGRKVFYIADYQFERDTSLPLDPDEQYEHDMPLPLGFNGQFEHDTALLNDPEGLARNVTYGDHSMAKHGTYVRCRASLRICSLSALTATSSDGNYI